MPRTTLPRYNGTSQVKKTRTPTPFNPVKITNLTFIESIAFQITLGLLTIKLKLSPGISVSKKERCEFYFLLYSLLW